jgi:DNA-binding transcriptional ArsR family regulator
MSRDLVKWALHEAPSLNPAAKTHPATARLVLVALAELARPIAFPAAALLCEMTDLSRKTVQRALKDLADARLIEKSGTRKSINGRVNEWKLNTSLKRTNADRQLIRERINTERAYERARWKGRQWIESVGDDFWQHADI